MWIVRLALRRPLSVAVMALLMLVLGTLCFSLMNVDIFPAINIPVVMVVWSYPGLKAIDMERHGSASDRCRLRGAGTRFGRNHSRGRKRHRKTRPAPGRDQGCHSRSERVDARVLRYDGRRSDLAIVLVYLFRPVWRMNVPSAVAPNYQTQ